jgi:hypothetical protein
MSNYKITQDMDEDYDSGAAKDKEKNDKYIKRRNKHGLKSGDWIDKSRMLNKKAVTGMSSEETEGNEEMDDLVEFKADKENSSVADATGVSAKKRLADKSDAGEPMQKLSPLRSDEVGDNLLDNGSVSKMPARKADKGMKEEVSALFDGELSEEFLDKASTLFEAAVIERVNNEVEYIEEQYVAALNEAVEEVKDGLVNKIDEFMNYVVEQWLEENRIAIESGIKTEITESFFSGLKTLFNEHYVDVPEDKIDLTEELANKVAELEGELNSALTRNIELTNIIEGNEIQDAFDDITEGLAVSQKEKLATLSESLVFSSISEYKSKLEVIKESLTHGSKIQSKAEQSLNEEFVDDAKASERVVVDDPEMQAYITAVRKAIKK